MNIVNLVISIAFWSLGFLLLFRIPRCKRSGNMPMGQSSVSVIIPARDEEESLPILLSSLREQDLADVETIVVVDDSDEKTAEVAEKNGVTVVRAGTKPEGWMGKPWACYQGAQAARGDVFLFLDADTIVERGGLLTILEECTSGSGVVSIQPYHRTRRPYEELSAYFNIIGMAGMGTFTPAGRRIPPVGLFGPCIAMTREQYFAVGGHETVKREVVEDLALGARLKRDRVPIFSYGGKGTVSFRMYPRGLRQLIEGWSKGFATGAVKTYLPILASAVLWIGGSINAARYVIQAVANLDPLMAAGWGTAYLAYCIQIYWMLFRLGTFRIYTALVYPVPLIFFLGVFLYSTFLIFVRRRVKWKGVSLSLNDKGTAG